MTSEIVSVIYICDDCMFHEANGECSSCPGELYSDTGHERTPLGEIEPGMHITLGMLAEEHHVDCDFRVSDGDAECNLECERETFSTHRCEGCGAQLAGARNAATLWRD